MCNSPDRTVMVVSGSSELRDGVQILKLTVEVRTRGTSKQHLSTKLKTKGISKILNAIHTQTIGKARTKIKYAIPILGTAKQKHVTTIHTAGLKGGTKKIIDILKQVLRDLE